MSTSIQVLNTQELAQVFAQEISRCNELVIVSAFVTHSGLDFLLNALERKRRFFRLYLLVRLDYVDIITGASDTTGLHKLFHLANIRQNLSVEVRRLSSLHAKLAIFDDRLATVGSANVTRGGLSINDEASVLLKKRDLVQNVYEIYQNLWSKAQYDVLTEERLQLIDNDISSFREEYKGLKDLGALIRDRFRLRSVRINDKSYIDSLLWILRESSKRNGLAVQQLEASLDADGAEKASAKRVIQFLQSLGLIEIETKGSKGYIRCLLCREDIRSIKMLQSNIRPRLLSRYSELLRFYDDCPIGTEFTYKEIAKLRGLSFGPAIYSEFSPPANWLEAIGLLSHRRSGSEKIWRRHPMEE